MPEVSSLDDLIVHTLSRVYEAEQRLLDLLPEMTRAADAPELRKAFESRFEHAERHVDRIQRLFALFDHEAPTNGDDPLTKIGVDRNTIRVQADSVLRDVVLIAAVQEAERYEIAAYQTLRTWAVMLGKSEAVDLLEQTLREQKRTDRWLTKIVAKFAAGGAPVM